MNYEILLLYSIVSFFYIIVPGPAIFLAIYNGISSGLHSVMASALGNIIGLMFLSALSISGLSAILMTSSTLFIIVKIIGAFYLIYLGYKQFRAGKNTSTNIKSTVTESTDSLLSFFREGLFVAITNPKPIAFFAALFPQFLDTDKPVFLQFAVMTLIFMFFSFLSLSTYGYLARRAKGLLASSGGIEWFHRISGGMFVGMGLGLFHIKNTS